MRLEGACFNGLTIVVLRIRNNISTSKIYLILGWRWNGHNARNSHQVLHTILRYPYQWQVIRNCSNLCQKCKIDELHWHYFCVFAWITCICWFNGPHHTKIDLRPSYAISFTNNVTCYPKHGIHNKWLTEKILIRLKSKWKCYLSLPSFCDLRSGAPLS